MKHLHSATSNLLGELVGNHVADSHRGIVDGAISIHIFIRIDHCNLIVLEVLPGNRVDSGPHEVSSITDVLLHSLLKVDSQGGELLKLVQEVDCRHIKGF